LWDLPVFRISLELVTILEKGKSSSRTAALASGQARFEMAFPPFLLKHLYHCDSIVIASFVGTGCTARLGGWLLDYRRN